MKKKKTKSKLPPLPKQYKRLEADFGVKLRDELLRVHKHKTAVFELKQCEGPSLPFDDLKPEQIAYLKSAKGSKGVVLRNTGRNGEPDYALFRNAPAWVVVKYKKSFYGIDIDDFLFERDRSKRRSLTKERAYEISTWHVDLK